MRRILLITGISTGIGAHLARFFHERGYFILGTVRKTKSAPRWTKELDHLHLFEMDLTDPSSVELVFEQIKDFLKSDKIYGLINNAGIAVAGPMLYLSMESFNRQMMINVTGLLDVTQRCFPLMMSDNARIINISSVSGLQSSPFLGAYSASKFAVEAISDSLRLEAALLGIKVVLVEPGPIQTPIWQKNDLLASEYQDTEYGPYLSQAKIIMQQIEQKALPLTALEKPLIHALEAATPRNRYLIYKHPILLKILIRFIPGKWKDYFTISYLKTMALKNKIK